MTNTVIQFAHITAVPKPFLCLLQGQSSRAPFLLCVAVQKSGIYQLLVAEGPPFLKLTEPALRYPRFS